MTNKSKNKRILSIETTRTYNKQEEGVVHYRTTKKFIVRVNIKGKYFSLKAFRFKKDATEFYNNWLLENR